MKKKEYIRPAIKSVNLLCEHLMVVQSGNEASNSIGSEAYSRESSMWDDEDEETENSMWK